MNHEQDNTIKRIATEILEQNGLKPNQYTIEVINSECIKIDTNKTVPEEKRKQLSEEIEEKADLANVFVV